MKPVRSSVQVLEDEERASEEHDQLNGHRPIEKHGKFLIVRCYQVWCPTCEELGLIK